MINVISAGLMLVGVLCIFVSVIGVFRMDYIMNRMHATTIADTLGTALIIAGAILYFGISWTSVKLMLVLIFQWATCPVSAHLITRMIYHSQREEVERYAKIMYSREKEEEF